MQLNCIIFASKLHHSAAVSVGQVAVRRDITIQVSKHRVWLFCSNAGPLQDCPQQSQFRCSERQDRKSDQRNGGGSASGAPGRVQGALRDRAVVAQVDQSASAREIGRQHAESAHGRARCGVGHPRGVLERWTAHDRVAGGGSGAAGRVTRGKWKRSGKLASFRDSAIFLSLKPS